jgi:hypothetical protein
MTDMSTEGLSAFYERPRTLVTDLENILAALRQVRRELKAIRLAFSVLPLECDACASKPDLEGAELCMLCRGLRTLRASEVLK